MIISDEIRKFDLDIEFLTQQMATIGGVNANAASFGELFIAESIAFRLYRAYERILRAIFLESCVSDTTPTGLSIRAKLRSSTHDDVEAILKVGKQFLDWGNCQTVRDLSTLVFENGFPVADVIGPLNNDLIGLQRIRNFIAHDSKEAASGFEKVVANYLPLGTQVTGAGFLMLSRRNPGDRNVLSQLLNKVGSITTVYLTL